MDNEAPNINTITTENENTNHSNISNMTTVDGIAKDASSDQGKRKREVGSRAVSKVWDHFTKLDGDPKYPRAACNYCGKDYACAAKKDGTSNMWTHLKVQCKKYPYRVEDKKQKTLLFEPKKDSIEVEGGQSCIGSLKTIIYNPEICRKALACMVITDELTFRFVEGHGFRQFCQVMQHKFTVPSRITVARDCMKLYFEEKEKLKRVLKSERICLTTDTWTSIQNINYMCLTAHWIDEEWSIHKRILNFCQVPNHKGETIGKFVESCLLDWGIDKILSVTVDNASSNDNVIKYLKRRTKDWKSTVVDNDFIHVRCCAHIVNLIVGEGLKDLDESIIKIRNAVRFVKSSPSRLSTFKKCVEKLKISHKVSLCLDVPTRWNSTYMMLEAAEKYERAFERLEEDDSRYVAYFSDDGNTIGPPDSYDWDNARVCAIFEGVL